MRTKTEHVPGPVYQERSQATGPLPTIGSMRRRGMTRFTVHCIALGYCGHQRLFSFEELKLPADMVFIAVSEMPWRCSKCGTRRKVEISPDWSDVRAPGDGRPVA